MKNFLRKHAVVIAALLCVLVIPALGAGLWPSLPIYGGAASTTPTGQTIPAGPSLPLTGNETIPMDTNIGSSAAAQTALVKPGDLVTYAKPYNTIASATTITPNLTTGLSQTTVLTAAAPGTTIAAPTGVTSGQRWTFKLVQDATGGRTVTWNTIYKWPSGTLPTLTATASKADIFQCSYDGTDHFCMTFGLNYTP